MDLSVELYVVISEQDTVGNSVKTSVDASKGFFLGLPSQPIHTFV